jgi:propionyl-CoA carboxylase alpha chain
MTGTPVIRRVRRHVPSALPRTLATLCGGVGTGCHQPSAHMATGDGDPLASRPGRRGAASVLTRVLIANRGEIAVRIARTCRAMGIGTVAVFSDVDAGALHVEACDQAVRLAGQTPAETYLRGELVVEAALASGADAVHPGFGFLSENAAFARRVVEAGLCWVGPPPDVIEAMGDKIIAKRRMAEAGVPLVPGAELLADGEDVRGTGDQVGYPLMVKAAAGGGGKGMRIVDAPDELEDAVTAARREAERAFGDGRVFLERLLTDPRHVEIQVLADTNGGVVHLFERECSIQRRHQKVIEESPSPGIDEEVRAAMGEAAVAAAGEIGYVGAGTVEFIADDQLLRRRAAGEDIDPAATFAFLEVNTRLQVEHPVTEETVRIDVDGRLDHLDLVRWQLLIADGRPLSFTQDQVVQVGHAIEARVYAEDPEQDYLPVAGTLDTVDWPQRPGLRYDSGVRTGDVVSAHYDPMLAKVIAWAPTRSEAAARLARALEDSVLLGTTTNRDLLARVLRHDAFLAGDTTTSFLGQHFGDPEARGVVVSPQTVDLALLGALVVSAQARRGVGALLPTLPVGFSNTTGVEHEMAFRVAGETRLLRYRQRRDGSWRVVQDGSGVMDLRARVGGDGRVELEVEGRRVTQRVVSHADRVEVHGAGGRVDLEVVPRFHEVAAVASQGVTLAPMPGSVVAVEVDEGDEVEEGELLVTVEAMKMEHRVTAPFAGRIDEVRVVAGQQVEADQVLVVVADPAAG